MYKITIQKAIYTKTPRGTKQTFKSILTTETTESNLIDKMLELKKLYRDFDYKIDFVKI